MRQMYRIADLQIPGRYFADGMIFKTKEEVVNQLLDYHSIDFDGSDSEDRELDIYKYLRHWKILGVKKELDWVLQYGQWRLERIKAKECRRCGELYNILESNYVGLCSKECFNEESNDKKTISSGS